MNLYYYHEHIHVKNLSSLEVQGLAKPFLVKLGELVTPPSGPCANVDSIYRKRGPQLAPLRCLQPETAPLQTSLIETNSSSSCPGCIRCIEDVVPIQTARKHVFKHMSLWVQFHTHLVSFYLLRENGIKI